MDKITKIRIKNQDGTYTDPVPIGADAENVVLSTGYTVEQTIGQLDININGNIKTQLENILKRLEIIEESMS